MKLNINLARTYRGSQKRLRVFTFALFCLSIFAPKLHAQTTPYNLPLLESALENTHELLPPFGKMQTRLWHIENRTITAGMSVPFDESQLDFLIFPRNPEIVPQAPPEYLKTLVERIEVLLFKKTGVLMFGLTRDTTAAFLKEKTITLGLDVLHVELGKKNERENLSFVVAHEIAHLIIFNEEIRTGLTPSGFVTASREMGGYSMSPEEYKNYIQNVVYPKESALAHAEVDLLACLILKRLGETVPEKPLERLMKDVRAKKQSTRALEDEYVERTKAIRLCHKKTN